MREPDRTKVTASWGIDAGHWAVLVHGGAGDSALGQGAHHVAGCRAAADSAAEVLRAGGTALDAVERAVVVLEDDPTFNAGTGACLNAQGLIELDAAIMEGSRLRAGGVCALPPFVHPIAIARAVLDDWRHVLYAAAGAERFAIDHGFTRASSDALTTEVTREQWARARANTPDAEAPGGARLMGEGTVGAVARDVRGGVAAATSTGGRVNKAAGRVGDTPILGAGTYADDEAGAGSATGDDARVLGEERNRPASCASPSGGSRSRCDSHDGRTSRSRRRGHPRRSVRSPRPRAQHASDGLGRRGRSAWHRPRGSLVRISMASIRAASHRRGLRMAMPHGRSDWPGLPRVHNL
jgi:L-asparaginase / beta-aspartyl-peptidase